MTVVTVGGDVFAGGEEQADEPGEQRYPCLSSRPSSFISAPCSDTVDVELTSSNFWVQNRYSWN